MNFDISSFEKTVTESIDQINDSLNKLKFAGIKIMESEFYFPADIPEIYVERLEILQEKLDALTKRLEGNENARINKF